MNQILILYVNTFIKLNLNQLANVNLNIYVMLFQGSDTFDKEFVPS
jgi:hypothetical protein